MRGKRVCSTIRLGAESRRVLELKHGLYARVWQPARIVRNDEFSKSKSGSARNSRNAGMDAKIHREVKVSFFQGRITT